MFACFSGAASHWFPTLVPMHYLSMEECISPELVFAGGKEKTKGFAPSLFASIVPMSFQNLRPCGRGFGDCLRAAGRAPARFGGGGVGRVAAPRARPRGRLEWNKGEWNEREWKRAGVGWLLLGLALPWLCVACFGLTWLGLVWVSAFETPVLRPPLSLSRSALGLFSCVKQLPALSAVELSAFAYILHSR